MFNTRDNTIIRKSLPTRSEQERAFQEPEVPLRNDAIAVIDNLSLKLRIRPYWLLLLLFFSPSLSRYR